MVERFKVQLVAAALACAIVSCSSDDDNAMNKAAYCSKCAECFAMDSYFQEGFCDPFWDGSSFDQETCTKEANAMEADMRGLTSSQLEEMSCESFDEQI